MGEEFDPWLCERLRELQTDETVFGPYIRSILEGEDEDEDEKIEALDGLLAELQGNFDVESVRNEILKRWNIQVTKAKQELPNGRAASFFGGGGDLLSSQPQSTGSADQTENVQQCSKTNGVNDTESILVNKMETIFKMTEEQISSKASSSSGSSAKSKGDIGADSALRAAILSQYCADDSSEDEGQGAGETKGAEGLSRNVNAEKVLAEQRDLKEKSRAEHAKKKERDKEDRNKQKQAQQDRKDKAKKKAQKVERKR